MKTIKVKSWICDCGYAQEFDPFDPENVRIHFHEDRSESYAAAKRKAGYSLLAPGQCPSCGELGGMRAAMPHETRTEMNILEASDLPSLRQELENGAPRKISSGFSEMRQETEEEKSERISKVVERQPESLRASVSSELNKSPLIVREFAVYREETPEEKSFRINKRMGELIPPSPEEVQALCEKHECK